MTRHPSLRELSRDHYFALEQALRLRRAQAESLAPAVDAFLEFWRTQMRQHFREEQEVLLPVFARYRPPDDPAAVTVLVQHVEIARRVMDLRARRDDLDLAHALGGLIEQHVRHEEQVLFPAVETALPEEALADLGARVAAFHRDERTPGCGRAPAP